MTRFMDFMRSRFGLPVLAGVVLFGFWLFWPESTGKPVPTSSGGRETNEVPFFSKSFPVPPAPEIKPAPPAPLPAPVPTPLLAKVAATVSTLVTPTQPVLFSSGKLATTESRPTVPKGRLLRCALRFAVTSASTETPVIGEVVEDLWWNGRLIVPATAEVHGRAQFDRIRERVIATGKWSVTCQDGRQFDLQAIALHEDLLPGGLVGELEGSVGLKGRVLKASSHDEVKLFLASALSAVASAMKQERPAVLGTYNPATVRNAGAVGASSVMDRYAQQVYEAIQKDGVYVHVPAGSRFYLYLDEAVPFVPEATLVGRIHQ